jgi:hypothetical protein
MEHKSTGAAVLRPLIYDASAAVFAGIFRVLSFRRSNTDEHQAITAQ